METTCFDKLEKENNASFKKIKLIIATASLKIGGSQRIITYLAPS